MSREPIVNDVARIGINEFVNLARFCHSPSEFDFTPLEFASKFDPQIGNDCHLLDCWFCVDIEHHGLKGRIDLRQCRSAEQHRAHHEHGTKTPCVDLHAGLTLHFATWNWPGPSTAKSNLFKI